MHVSHWFGPEGGRAAYSTLVATVINQDPSVAPETMVDVVWDSMGFSETQAF